MLQVKSWVKTIKYLLKVETPFMTDFSKKPEVTCDLFPSFNSPSHTQFLGLWIQCRVP